MIVNGHLNCGLRKGAMPKYASARLFSLYLLETLCVSIKKIDSVNN